MIDAARASHLGILERPMNRRQSLTLFALAPVLLGVSAFVATAVKDQSYIPSPVYTPVGEPSRKDAVVYYSRSGHSEAVAREIARLFNAPIARISSDYPLSFNGQRKALADASNESLPAIAVEPIDLLPVQRVYLVSPTWLFRPATPLWAYVQQTDLTGKEVVLFTTGNSRFKQTEIDEFGKWVEARGGRLIRHDFIRRGRIYWQMSRKELLDAVRAKVSESSTFAKPR
jgi:flavodoxin